MKKKWIASVTIAFLLVTCGSAAAGKDEGIRPSDVAGGPTAFCKVLKEPDATLLGGWQGVHNRFIKGESSHDSVQFFLKKYGSGYAIYFYRSKELGGGKVLRGWRPFTINGNVIHSDTGVTIFAEKGEVFFRWEMEMEAKPTKMTHIPGSEKW